MKVTLEKYPRKIPIIGDGLEKIHIIADRNTIEEVSPRKTNAAPTSVQGHIKTCQDGLADLRNHPSLPV